MKIHYATRLFFIAVILTLFFVNAETTFFDNPDDVFIMGNPVVTSPTGGVVGGATEGTASGGGCLTNWSCSSWSFCVDGIQTRNCTKERINCYADLKKKPIENQSCFVEIENDTEYKKESLIFQNLVTNFKNTALVIMVLIIIMMAIVFFFSISS